MTPDVIRFPLIPGESKKDRNRRIMKDWQKRNAVRLAAYYTQWGRAHREQKRASLRKYYRNHKKEKAASVKRYREENAIKVKSRRRLYDARPDRKAARAITTKRWIKANPEKIRARNARRKALIRGVKVIDRMTDKIIARWKAATFFICYYCKNKYRTFGTMHVDHIVPISKGGAHAVGNICRSCGTCNMRKRDRSIVDLHFLKQPLLAV